VRKDYEKDPHPPNAQNQHRRISDRPTTEHPAPYRLAAGFHHRAQAQAENVLRLEQPPLSAATSKERHRDKDRVTRDSAGVERSDDGV